MCLIGRSHVSEPQMCSCPVCIVLFWYAFMLWTSGAQVACLLPLRISNWGNAAIHGSSSLGHLESTSWLLEVIWSAEDAWRSLSGITALPTNNDTATFFFSASSQIGKLTDFVVTCHISSLFLSISVENRLEHIASISKSSCTASGIEQF